MDSGCRFLLVWPNVERPCPSGMTSPLDVWEKKNSFSAG